MTVVVVGGCLALHGRVSFAHHGRVAVVLFEPLEDPEQLSGAVVVTALSEGRVFSMSGQIRDASERSLSLDLHGDLRGSDPRRTVRVLETGETRLSVSWGDSSVVGTVRDVSEGGLSVLLPSCVILPADGASVILADGPERRPLGARVCHRIHGLDGSDCVRMGLGLPAGCDARILSSATRSVGAE
ncbi:MAG: hypothetical protein CL927_03180 [Deltaproteobacteria bacterium]|nr:hypothetical protein [Deltaproteobacteria bacterium]HCH61719.1 hypothetical protein [Deltaproteobacteria bacterium]